MEYNIHQQYEIIIILTRVWSLLYADVYNLKKVINYHFYDELSFKKTMQDAVKELEKRLIALRKSIEDLSDSFGFNVRLFVPRIDKSKRL
ncbi:hypothetical protein KBD08_03780 [Candidatus Babeliales bacterium]|nr:hypothetical protein [Candidatus Babeliales bacterium]